MKTTKSRHLASIAILVLTLACAFALSACGSGGNSSGTFTGMQPRDAADMEQYASKAIAIGIERQEAESSDAEEGELSATVASEFAEGNEAYRNGNYASAQSAYEKAIEKYPMHFGSNVNLVLAQLQQGKNEDALVQALTCVYLFDDDAGCILNAQVAGTACGFGDDTIDAIIKEVSIVSVESLLERSSSYLFEYRYNSLWNRIETLLYQAAQVSDDERAQYQDEFMQLLEEMDALEQEKPDDKDVKALSVYLLSVGVQLGYIESDATSQAA